MGRSRDRRTRVFAGKELEATVPMRSNMLMPRWGLPRITGANLHSLDRGLELVAEGPLIEDDPGRGLVEVDRIIKRSGLFEYRRHEDYPKHHPLDKYLFSFIQSYVPADMAEGDPRLPAERRHLERAILECRDSMLHTCATSFPSFPLNFSNEVQFPSRDQLGFFSEHTGSHVHRLTITPVVWDLHGHHKVGSTSFTGLFLKPSGSTYVNDGYDNHCMLNKIMSLSIPSWYGKWSVVSSHRFRLGATEWLFGVLHHYGAALENLGIRHAVTAALYNYPCHMGLLQGLSERFNRRWNTFGTAEGETALDLWSFHRISGLPISGFAYEEATLDDLHRNCSTGQGEYELPHSFRYLMKVWRDLARAGKDKAPSSSSSTVRVSLNAWIRYFYSGPYCFSESFAEDDKPWEEYYELLVDQKPNKRYLVAPKGWNPHNIPDTTYLAAYLAYWLATFVVPYGEDDALRAELIYPACLLADGKKLALAPAALANIYHSLGSLTSHNSPRDKHILMATHYLSAWASLLLPSLSQRIGSLKPCAPLIFLFRNRPNLDPVMQLAEARRSLCYLPTGGRQGMDFAHSSLGFRPYLMQSRGSETCHLPHHQEPCPSSRDDWVYSTRPSVFVFRKGTTTILEPYYPHRFARNFGYDQTVPPNAEFSLNGRQCKNWDTHLMAASWWDFFFRREPETQSELPDPTKVGCIDMYYAKWWFNHSNIFRLSLGALRKAEEAHLVRMDLPPLRLESSFLRAHFSTFGSTLKNIQAAWKSEHGDVAVDKNPYLGAIEPLPRPTEVHAGSEKITVYSWWDHFLADCGLSKNSPPSSEICPGNFCNSAWEIWQRHLINAIGRAGPLECISLIEEARTLGDVREAAKRAAKIININLRALVSQPPPSLGLSAGKFVVFKVPSNPIRRAPAPPKKRRAAECDNRPTKVSCSRTKEPSSHNGKDLESAGAADKGSFPPADNTILSQLEAEINDDHHLNLELDDLDANYDYNPLSDESPGLSSGNPAGHVGDEERATPLGRVTHAELSSNSDLPDSTGVNSTESVRAYTALLDSKLNEEFPDYGDAPDIDTETVAEYSQALLSNIQCQVAPLSLPEVTATNGIMPKLSATLETIGEMPQRAESSDPTDLQNTGYLPLGHSDTLHPAEGEVYHRPSSEIAEHSEMQIHGSIISSLDGLQGGMPQPPTNASVEESGRSSSESTLAGHARLDAGENIADMERTLCEEQVVETDTIGLLEVLTTNPAPTETVETEAPYPPLEVEWPDSPESEALANAETVTLLIAGLQKLNRRDVLHSVDDMRSILRRHTQAYHMMGLPREPWMDAIKSVWQEFCRLRAIQEERVTIQAEIQQLRVDISTIEATMATNTVHINTIWDDGGILAAAHVHKLVRVAELRHEAEELLIASQKDADMMRMVQANIRALLEANVDLGERISINRTRIVELQRRL